MCDLFSVCFVTRVFVPVRAIHVMCGASCPLPTTQKDISLCGGYDRPPGRNVTSFKPLGFDSQACGDVTSSSSLGRRPESREGIIGGHDGNGYVVVSHNFPPPEKNFRKGASIPRTLPPMKSSRDEGTISSGCENMFAACVDGTMGRAVAASMSTSQQGLRLFSASHRPHERRKDHF